MRRRRLGGWGIVPTSAFAAVVLLCFSAGARGADIAAGAARSAVEAELVAAHQALRRIPQQNPWVSGPGPSGLVPKTAAALLQQLRNRLSAVVSQTVQTDGTGSLTPEQVRSRVVAHLEQLGIKVSNPAAREVRAAESEEPINAQPAATDSEDSTGEEAERAEPEDSADAEVIFPHGEILQIAVCASAEDPDLLVLVPEIRTGAGTDASLYMFRRRERQWQLVLAADDKGDYNAISSDRDVVLSPPDEKGNSFVVATTMTGGLNGSQGTLRYKVLRPGRDPRSPKTLLRGERRARRNFDPYVVRTQAGGFELEFVSSAVDRRGEFDVDEIVGTRLLRFKVSGDQVKLVARRQLKPHEFDLPASADE